MKHNSRFDYQHLTGLKLRCFVRYKYLTYQCPFHRESYKLNIRRDFSYTKFNQSILQVKKKQTIKKDSCYPVDHTASGRTGIQTLCARPLILHQEGLTNVQPSRSPLLLPPCLAIPGEFLWQEREKCYQMELRLRFPHSTSNIVLNKTALEQHG